MSDALHTAKAYLKKQTIPGAEKIVAEAMDADDWRDMVGVLMRSEATRAHAEHIRGLSGRQGGLSAKLKFWKDQANAERAMQSKRTAEERAFFESVLEPALAQLDQAQAALNAGDVAGAERIAAALAPAEAILLSHEETRAEYVAATGLEAPAAGADAPAGPAARQAALKAAVPIEPGAGDQGGDQGGDKGGDDNDDNGDDGTGDGAGEGDE